MRYFTAKEILVGGAGLLWAVSLLIFLSSDKSLSDIAVNLLTDIGFAIFIALYIEHLNERERDQANKARKRAVALAVRKFFQTTYHLLGALIDDALETAKPTALPSIADVRGKAAEKHGSTGVNADFWQQPVPYIAYFLCWYRGDRQAKVFPPRPTYQYVSSLASELEPNYRDIFHLDNGIIPDHVVDALTALKDHHLFAMARLSRDGPIRLDYWTESDIGEIAACLTVLSKFFGPLLELSYWSPDDTLHNFVVNALNRHGVRIAQ